MPSASVLLIHASIVLISFCWSATVSCSRLTKGWAGALDAL
jgi:hypothetical protein